MIVLGVDTSTDSLTVSAVDEKRVLAERKSSGALMHSSLLIPMVEKTMSKIGAALGKVDLFAVGTGPGSFTGLRVGITAMRALAIATDKPIIAIPSIDAIGYNGFRYIQRGAFKANNVKICPMVDAKKGQVYACIYAQNTKCIIRTSDYLLEPPAVLAKRLRGEVLFLGDAIQLYRNLFLHKKGLTSHFLGGPRWHPKASVIARLALDEYRKGRRDDVYDLVPMYLYARDCNVRKP